MKAFEIVFEDPHLIVVNKAPGVLTVPTPKRERNTLVDRLQKLLRGKRPFVVHRLDRETSGILVFAKDERTGRALVSSWASLHERRYLAIVHGVMKDTHGEIRSNLITTRNLSRRSSSDGTGELAVTRFSVLECVSGATLVELELITGRRNQIRVHMADKGHPVLGDERYSRGAQHALWRTRRLALHARCLVIVHPITKQKLTFEATTPFEFSSFLDAARIRTR